MLSRLDRSAPETGRRFFFRLLCAAPVAAALATPMTTAAAATDTAQRFRVSVACASEVPAVRLDGLGFSCADVRRSFELAARGQPLDLTFYDNRGDRNAALTNVDEAIRGGTQLFIQYDPDAAVNAATGTRLKAAGIPALGLNHLVPGAPLYGSDNAAAGLIAGQALAEFATVSRLRK